MDDAQILLTCPDEELWYNFVMTARGYSFEGLYKFEVFEKRKYSRRKLLQTVLGKDPFIGRYKNANYKYFYR